MPVPKNVLPSDVVKKLFRYDPERGLLYWRTGRNAGKIAGARIKARNGTGKDGARQRIRAHISLKIGGKRYGVHNLIWAYVTGECPTQEVDHANRDGTDNRWSNLRSATRAENQANTNIYKSNELGIRGVYRVAGAKSKPFRATYSLNQKKTHVGYFETAEEAHAAWVRAVRGQYGAFVASEAA